jgi:ribose transport system substrate-binding protein
MTGIFVATSAPAAGAASAVIEAGKQGKIKIAAFDADPQQIEDLKDGVYDVLVAQNPYQMGYDAVENLAKYVRGEITKSDFTTDVVHYDVSLITRDNVDAEEVQHFKYIAELSEVGY